MFNLNEDNHIVMAEHPTDMRMGVNGMCGQVRKMGLEPSNGDVYIFVGKSRTTMKLLHWEREGYVMYYKSLEQGRFHPRIFLRQGIGFRSMRRDERNHPKQGNHPNKPPFPFRFYCLLSAIYVPMGGCGYGFLWARMSTNYL